MADQTPLTVAQAATLLGLSRRMIYDLANTGKLRGYRFGRALRFDLADVMEYKQACRFDGTPETSAGATNSTALFKASGTAFLDFCRKAGLKPKLTPSTEKKAPASTRLRVVSGS